MRICSCVSIRGVCSPANQSRSLSIFWTFSPTSPIYYAEYTSNLSLTLRRLPIQNWYCLHYKLCSLSAYPSNFEFWCIFNSFLIFQMPSDWHPLRWSSSFKKNLNVPWRNIAAHSIQINPQDLVNSCFASHLWEPSLPLWSNNFSS